MRYEPKFLEMRGARAMRMRLLLAGVIALLAGCSMTTPGTRVHQPMSARPVPVAEVGVQNGAIYRDDTARLTLFLDRRARFVGDTLTIVIEEKNSASKKSSSNTAKTGKTEIAVPVIQGVPGKTWQGIDVEANSANNFSGQGAASSNNAFSGNLTVTVIEVLTNGNLLVSGEKQVTINEGTEFIRVSGVVNPLNISTFNTVPSWRVADARVEYLSNGYLDEAQIMPWMQRFFLNVSPF